MNHRRHATVPALALWTLIVVGNMAMIVANAGAAVVVATVGLIMFGLVALGVLIVRRGQATPARLPAPIAVPVRRRT